MTDFSTFARDHGLIIRDLIPDGRVHRVPTEGHPRKRNGAYAFDGTKGFVQAWDIHPEAIPFRGGRGERIQRLPERLRAVSRDRKAAEALARQIVARSAFQSHPYLTRKGFPRECALVDPDDGRLIVPMHDANSYSRLLSVQRIAEDGSKLFLKDGIAKDAVFHLGRGSVDILVEGFATGLSVRAAIEAMYRRARIVVCFSAGNLANVARLYPRAVVVADNDASGAGEAAARMTGRRWAMSDRVGEDANDLHQRAGLRAVVAVVNQALEASS